MRYVPTTLSLLALLLLGACGSSGGGVAPVVVGKGHDADTDGLGSTLETTGWEILIDDKGFGPFSNGATLTTRHVTSDPNLDDTDGDGVLDGDEYHLRTDPRSEDTDGDGLTDFEEWKRWLTSPVSVDTDGDARGPDPAHPLAPNPDLFDGAELHFDANGKLLGTSTSPTLADTDGDGASDYEEVGHAWRSLVLAEIPDARIILDGPIDVFLNVEYEESKGQESTYGTSVTTTRSETNSTGSSNTLEENLRLSATVTAGVEGEVGTMGASTTVSGEISGTVEQSWMAGTTQTTTQESTSALQRESSKLETDRRENTEIAASGTITAGITIENTSPSSTVRLESLGIAVRHWQRDGLGGKTFRTLGTLRPDIPGFTLPPGARTPVLRVAAEDVSPDVIRRFLAEPGSLHLAPAYFDLVDEQGIDFAFLAENAFSQTAVVEINYGDGDAETYRVATNVDRDAQGQLAGITMGEVMTSVLGLSWAEAASTTTICGGNPLVLTEVNGRVGSAGFVQGVDDPKSFRIWRTAMNRPGFLHCDNWSEIVLKPGDIITLTYATDSDGDGLTDATEESLGTKNVEDCDGDGLKDGAEAALGWWAGAPGVAATDTPEASEILLSQLGYPRLVYSNPRLVDTDGDGLNDKDEKWKGCDPTAPDTDGDGILDGVDPFPLLRGVRLHVDATVSGGDGSSWPQALRSAVAALAQARRDNLRALTLIRSTSGTTLQEKVDSVRAPDGKHWPDNLVQGRTIVTEIWVADGTYSRIDLLENDVGVYGGFTGALPDGTLETKRGARNADPSTNSTVIVADGSWPALIVSAATTRSTVLDGFVLTGARRSGSDGGGIECEGSPILRNLLVTNNEAGRGGGLYVRSGAPLIERCQFSQNQSFVDGGGAIFIEQTSAGAAPVIRGSTLISNVGYGRGGAILITNAAGVLVEDCEIAGNGLTTGSSTGWKKIGAGICLADAEVVVTDTTFDGNSTDPAAGVGDLSATVSYDLVGQTRGEEIPPGQIGHLPDHRCGGAVHQDGGEATFVQCVFRGNSASQGAGIRAVGPDAALAVVNCTFAHNWITARGTSIATRNASLYMYNTILGPGGRLRDELVSIGATDPTDPTARINQILQIETEQDPVVNGTAITPSVYFNATVGGLTADFRNCLWVDLGAWGSNKFGLIISAQVLGSRTASSAGFVSPWDLRLSAGSPAIDAGNALIDALPLQFGFQLLPATDARGASRVVDGDGDGQARVDIGAYEFR